MLINVDGGSATGMIRSVSAVVLRSAKRCCEASAAASDNRPRTERNIIQCQL
jgi:hypothetical protein